MRIALTGGGTAGHVMVGSVLIPMLLQSGWSVIYVGSTAGVERKIIEGQGLVKYYAVSTGKLRRYFSLQNLIDPFKVMVGFIKAYRILKKEMPHVIFSGGGYVSVPVVVAAKVLGIPILLRETDYTVGLANKICLKFASAFNVTFPDTAKQISSVPVSNHGMIIRATLLQKADQNVVFRNIKPIILVMGGSLGAGAINNAVRKDLSLLLFHYNIVHLCGISKREDAYNKVEGYQQIEFLEDMASCYQMVDVVLMRCGSNSVCEGLALGKQMICVPLTRSRSRGEQYANAEFAVKNGNAVIIKEEELCGQKIINAVEILKKQLKNNHMTITSAQLQQNCMEQIGELHGLGMKKLHQDCMEHVYHGKKIDFFSLTEDEIFYYNEVAEEYGI